MPMSGRRVAARPDRPAAAGSRPADRVGDRPGEQRGRICRCRRPGPSRPADRGRHGCLRVHPGRRRAHRPLRLRPRLVASPAAAADGRHHVERATPRHGVRPGTRSCAEVIRDYPGLTVDWMLVDAMTQRVVNKPGSIDTVLATQPSSADILRRTSRRRSAGRSASARPANIDPSRRRLVDVRADPRLRLRPSWARGSPTRWARSGRPA